MYCKTEKIPIDIYRVSVCVAKSYYRLLERRKTLVKGSKSRPFEKNEEKINAIERALEAMTDRTKQEAIRLNLFEGVPIQSIDLPLSISSIKRARKTFIVKLAENLGEI